MDRAKPKHRAIFETLRRQIAAGKYTRRLPSEMELARRFAVSRPTAARAVRDLQSLGLLSRRVGSGTYLRDPLGEDNSTRQRTLGLLVPGLGNTEIVDPICNEITHLAQMSGYTVLWGDTPVPTTLVDEIERLCQEYVDRKVAGVFFAPLQSLPDNQAINLRIVAALRRAVIVVVLLDREVLDFPGRSDFDLIGIDNFQAAFLLSQHLIGLGHRRIHFLARLHPPSTNDLRIAGCREAMVRADLTPPKPWIWMGDPGEAKFVQGILRFRPQAVICANDLMAAMLIQTLTKLGYHLPRDIAVAGFDDVKYATLLAVPLTTVRQPCRQISEVAVRIMLERLENPQLPPRQVLLPVELMVRQSCGAGLGQRGT